MNLEVNFSLDKPTLLRALAAGVQAGAAAGLAWWFGLLLGMESPAYAPVAAVVVIGAGYERRVERVGSMLAGMGIAIAISEIGIRLVGTGPVQIAVLTGMAIVAARLIVGDLLAVAYAGLNAAILVGLGGEGWVPDRLLEGLVGAVTAYILVYLVFPPRPTQHIKRAISDQVDHASKSLAVAAAALRSPDKEDMGRADVGSGRVDRNAGAVIEALDFSREVSRYSPWRRGYRSQTDLFRRRAAVLQTVLRNTTAAVRVLNRLARQDFPEDHLAEAADRVRGSLNFMSESFVEGAESEAAAEAHRMKREVDELVDQTCENEGSLHAAAVALSKSVAEDIVDAVGSDSFAVSSSRGSLSN